MVADSANIDRSSVEVKKDVVCEQMVSSLDAFEPSDEILIRYLKEK